MYKKRQLVSIRLWLMMLSPLMLTALLPNISKAQCNYNEGASPTFNVTGNNASAGYSTVVIATDDVGGIAYLSATSSKQLQNLAAGKYNVYSFNYHGTAPASLTVGGSISALLAESSCAALSTPTRIGVCKCTNELPVSGNLSLNLIAAGQNTMADYTQQYLLLGPDGKIRTISNTPNFEFSEVNNYSVYGINYKTNGGVSGLSVGNGLAALTGACFDIASPLDLNVCPTGSLPVTLISFQVTARENAAELNWATSEETNSDRFEIQHSLNGKTWNAIGSVKSEGESTVRRAYGFVDQQPRAGENNFYRLKMIDRDSTFAFSIIRNVRFENLNTSSIYPNPVTAPLSLKVSDWKQVKAIRIDNLSGLTVYRSGPLTSGQIDVSTLNPGTYILSLIHTDESVRTHKFVHVK